MNRMRKIQGAQFLVIILCALALKLHYATASADQLRWILGPTTSLVEIFSGSSFQFESYAGYMSSNHRFLVATSCAGVNFMITAFLMLALRALLGDRSSVLSWKFIPLYAGFAYVATIIANTVRICVALWLQHVPDDVRWLSWSQLHRIEGIIIYFGFLLLLFVLTEKGPQKSTEFVRKMGFTLIVYYSMTLIIPLLNGSHRDRGFFEHSVVVLVLPLIMVGALVALRSLWPKPGPSTWSS
ncbi:MAG TPA: exosortase K [Pyrinomonadaceae bacterium]|nr:exosortase K [Pyrinomonadaceae bacterium]